jgi:2-polyprenyl-3-methyl-5-hydroxy-6-metoxy-1,4-benzoquinol methylase
MERQAVAEVGYWNGRFKHFGEEEFLKLKKIDWDSLSGKFNFKPFIAGQRGVDLGCGLVSMFEFSEGLEVVAVDPLRDEYNKIYITKPNPNIIYQKKTETLRSEAFDFVWLVNVIDHTPDPTYLIEESFRLLKPGGLLYLEVNFDDILLPSHYRLWNDEVVKELLPVTNMIFSFKERLDQHGQWRFYAIFTK